MKNIFIIPTDQPSRLHYYHSFTPQYALSKESLNWRTSSHIYITSLEDIKEDDFVYSTKQDYNIQKVSKELVQVYRDCGHYKKIILTTDPTLIADGVQAIDDEFLEWFVKNPTCEFVEVNYELGNCLNCEWNHDMCPNAEECLKNKYMIIIPQEEQKQHLINMMHDDEELGLYEEPKQESLEKAAERLQKDKYGIFISKDADVKGQLVIDTAKAAFKSGMIEGANYQAERMYSEEEVIELLTARCKHFGTTMTPFRELLLKQDLEWFNQFKKK